MYSDLPTIRYLRAYRYRYPGPRTFFNVIVLEGQTNAIAVFVLYVCMRMYIHKRCLISAIPPMICLQTVLCGLSMWYRLRFRNHLLCGGIYS